MHARGTSFDWREKPAGPWPLEFPKFRGAARPSVSESHESGPDALVSELTAGLARGDEESWREFHRTYFDRLLRYLLVVVRGDEEAARDALQQTLLRVNRHVRRFESEAVFWSWLSVLARSAARDGARHQNRYTALLASYAREWFCRVDPSTSSANHDADQQLNLWLRETLAELPAEERALILARYETRSSIPGMAVELGTTPKAVESRLARIRERLRLQLLKRIRNEAKP